MNSRPDRGPLTPERYRRIRDIFEECLDLEPDERASHVREAASGDAGVEDEVLEMLELHKQIEGDTTGGVDLEHLIRTIEKCADEPGVQTAEALAAAMVGQTLAGKYRIDRVLGWGGMGTVFAATHLTIDKKRAVKVMHGSLSLHPAMRERFLREAKMLGTLDHPNVVEIYDSGSLPEGGVYIEMALLEGRSLRERMDEGGPVPVDEAVEIARQTLAALDAAHARGIVHRDIKAPNIYLVGNSEGIIVKVLDFGIAKLEDPTDAADPLTRTGQMFGTPQYMAPEQWTFRPVDARTDLYSLGVVLFEMIAGRLPFDEKNYQKLGAKVTSSTPPKLDEVAPACPLALAEVVARLLEKNPPDRYQTAEAAARALARAMNLREGFGAWDGAWKDGVSPGVQRRQRRALRRRAFIAVSAAGVGALLWVLAWLAVVRPESAPATLASSVSAGPDVSARRPKYDVLFFDDFEQGPGQWDSPGGMVLTTASAASGARSQTFSRVFGGGDAKSRIIAVTPGQTYYLHANYRTLGGGGDISLDTYDSVQAFAGWEFFFSDSGYETNSSVEFNVFEQTAALLGQWRVYTQAYTVPDTVRFVRIKTQDWAGGLPDDPINHGIFFDTIEFSTSPSPVFALPATEIALAGTVSDDGVPPGSPLVRSWSVVGGPGPVTFADASAPETVARVVAPGTYVLRLTASDGERQASDEMVVTIVADNAAPRVNAGPDWEITTIDEIVTLAGRLADDAQPVGSTPVPTWSVISGPGQVWFGDPAALETTLTVSATGTYVLRLSASDGEYTAHSDVRVHVGRVTPNGNRRPVVDAGRDRSVTPNTFVRLAGSFTDTTIPAGGQINTGWSGLVAPGIVSFVGNGTRQTPLVRFDRPGRYTLSYYVDDGFLSSIDFAVFTVSTTPNTAPALDAGPDQHVALGTPAHVSASAIDDGVPGVPLVYEWRAMRGPGPVVFSSSHAASTMVSTSVPGRYVLQVKAHDSQADTIDEVVLEVTVGN